MLCLGSQELGYVHYPVICAFICAGTVSCHETKTGELQINTFHWMKVLRGVQIEYLISYNVVTVSNFWIIDMDRTGTLCKSTFGAFLTAHALDLWPRLSRWSACESDNAGAAIINLMSPSPLPSQQANPFPAICMHSLLPCLFFLGSRFLFSFSSKRFPAYNFLTGILFPTLRTVSCPYPFAWYC